MKKTMTWLLGLAMVLLSGLAFGNATVHSMTGTASAQIGAGTPRPLRTGDTVRPGETVITGANSTAVLRFPDGQVAGLTPNSRMLIEAYQYNEQAKTGNILLSLISGGMRAVTGLIGRNSPDKVSYKAATATIGIRGTDVILVVAGQNIVVSVNAGVISFTYGGRVITIQAGQGATVINGQLNQVAAERIAEVLGYSGLEGMLGAVRAATNPDFAASVNNAWALGSVGLGTTKFTDVPAPKSP